jgi:ADP-ribosylarginine hydrolase
LRFPGVANRKFLIKVALESGRITHNHPVAFFGAVVAALFTAYAIEGHKNKQF